MNLFRGDLVPFFEAGDGNLVMVDADTIQPFLILGDVQDRNQGLARRLVAVLRKIRSGKRYLQQLADHQRLGKGRMIEWGELFGIDIVHPADAIPVLFCDDGVLQVQASCLALDNEFIGLGSGKLCKKTADQ